MPKCSMSITWLHQALENELELTLPFLEPASLLSELDPAFIKAIQHLHARQWVFIPWN